DLSAFQTRLTSLNTWCCCSYYNTTKHNSTIERSDIPECEIPIDNKGVKRILMKLKDEAGNEKRALDLKYKKIKLLEDYLALK
ncbi:MAG: hypothetical protein EXX96DRAFT_482699, partial [Benjaminiella poitrasii]